MNRFLPFAAAFAVSLSTSLAADSTMIGNYDLGTRKTFSYEIDPQREPLLYIAVELVFHGALREEPGSIEQFCLLVKKIVNSGGSAEAYAMDLGYIITLRGDEAFAGEIASTEFTKKEKQRLWVYLAGKVDGSKYPQTRKVLLGK